MSFLNPHWISWLRELKALLLAICHFPFGCFKRCFFAGLNPRRLSKEEASHPALLLLHGDWHNQSGWLPLAWKLKRHYKGAIFSINSNARWGRKRIQAKLREIRQMAQKSGASLPIQIILIGHSMGGILAAETLLASPPLEGLELIQAISIGGRLQPKEYPFYKLNRHLFNRLERLKKRVKEKRDLLTRLYSIGSEADWLVPPEATTLFQPPEQQCLLEGEGHLSLLYSERVHEQIFQWLQAPLPSFSKEKEGAQTPTKKQLIA